jgi:hypothetical protein
MFEPVTKFWPSSRPNESVYLCDNQPSGSTCGGVRQGKIHLEMTKSPQGMISFLPVFHKCLLH